MEYYLAMKRNEIPTHATCMNLEDIMLSKISQSQKDKYCMIPFIGGISRAVKFIETESRMVPLFDCQGLGLGGNEELLL